MGPLLWIGVRGVNLRNLHTLIGEFDFMGFSFLHPLRFFLREN